MDTRSGQMRRLPALLLLVLLLLLLLPTSSAQACTCGQATNRQLLASADAALVGDAVSTEGTTPSSLYEDTTVRVTHDLMDNLESVVVIHHMSNGNACGDNLMSQGHVAMTLWQDEEGWSTGYCNRLDEKAFFAAGGPRTDPDPDIVSMDQALNPVRTDEVSIKIYGGSSRPPFLLIGFGVVIASVAGVIALRRRRMRGRSSSNPA